MTELGQAMTELPGDDGAASGDGAAPGSRMPRAAKGRSPAIVVSRAALPVGGGRPSA